VEYTLERNDNRGINERLVEWAGKAIQLVNWRRWGVSHSQFAGSFIEFYPHYFDGFYAFGGNFAWMGLHSWYLEMLFIFSLITLPLFLYLRKEAMHGLISVVY
jgi:hypothetical protein